MRKALIILGALLIVWSLTIIGCGDDDDCPACPDTKQKAVMFGQAQIYEGMLEFYGYVFGIDGLIPDVDSVKVDGHKADLEEGFGEGMGMAWIEYAGPAGTLDSGDDIVINIYTPTGSSSCTITLLEDGVDDPVAIGWEMSWPYDTVALGEAIEITWNRIPNADWYLFDYDYSYYNGSINVYQSNEPVYLTDTTFTIPGSATGFNGYYYIDIIAATGTGPDATAGNITGVVVKGVINSSAYSYFTVYVGDGDAWPVAQAPAQTLTDDKLRVLELMKKLHFDK